MKTLTDIRSTFLNYFARNGHQVVESSPLVPRNDPTLMFTNSGMVQFKNVFTGVEKRPYTRATTAQKSVRAGGKHNDLENVGYTARHHTFFEMLGNFSFGDYFKEQAIAYAWELVTKDFGLSPKNLLVTVYHEDDEAAGLWKKIAGFSDDKIIRIHTSANFWRMGDVGPCGPCTEIFIDQGPVLQGGPPGSPEEDGDRFLEFWNLVFMQFEEQEGGKRINLPKPSVDTGMGLERMAAILQGVHSNYDVDLFKHIIGTAADILKVDANGPQKASYRVMADHVRATSFLLADGVMPSNEGRGYVLRRIMRRAMRHANLLGAKEPVIYRLVPELVKHMGVAYPELVRAQSLITETLKLEETRFLQTLGRGLKLLEEETAKLPHGTKFSGDTAFKLYDTFGFPIDLTQDALRAKNIDVDMAAFDAALERQRADARKAWAGSGEVGDDKVWFDVQAQHQATEFLGYSTEDAEAVITTLVLSGQQVQNATGPSELDVLTNQTPFYAESGGQVGDEGWLQTEMGQTIFVKDTQKKLGKYFAHRVVLKDGEKLSVGDKLRMRVNHQRRNAIRAHHSATHLLHQALRERLGTHVAQQGSRVAHDRLRFDISQPVPPTPDDLRAVEYAVNERVQLNSEVTTRIMTPDEAIKLGAMALFGEKYGDEVRVVSMGGPVHDREYSIELCGGTHVTRTGDIGLFKIIGESAVAAGVRRIEAVTGQEALKYFQHQENLLQQVAAQLKVAVGDVPQRLDAVMDERRKLEREVADLRRQLALGGFGGGAANSNDAPRVVAGVNFISRVLHDMPARELKPLADQLKAQVKSGVVAVVASFEEKVSVVVAVTPDLAGKVDAVELVKVAASAVGGQGGGGRPDMAQAGGTNVAQMPAAIAAIEKVLGGA